MEGLFGVNVQDPHHTWQNLKIADGGRVYEIRQRLEELWQCFYPYADSNFRHEFAKHPHQRFWEMLLCVFLLRSGKNVIAQRDRAQSGPDILVKEAGATIWIEAVTPTPGEPPRPDTVPDFRADGEVYSVPDDSLLLRFLQAMNDKRNRLQSYVDDSLIAPDDLRIIAINAGDQKGFGGLTGVFERVLYPTRIKTWGNTDWTWGAPCDVVKNNGSVVPASVFVRADYQDITGVIFSPSTIGDMVTMADFHYCPNPNSDTRLPVKWIQWTREFIMFDSLGHPALIELEHCQEVTQVLGQFPSSPSAQNNEPED